MKLCAYLSLSGDVHRADTQSHGVTGFTLSCLMPQMDQ